MQGQQNTGLAKAFETEDATYWIGALLSDGNVYHPPKGNPEISLTMLDKEHVEKFRDFVGHWNPLYHTKYGTWRYRFNSKEAAEKLAEFNVLPAKSLTAEAPEALVDSADFWRGMIDGDGSIVKLKQGGWQVQLVGTEKVCQQFLDYANSLCYSRAKVHTSGPNLYRVRISAKKAVSALLEELYVGASVSLDRKRQKAEAALSL